MLSILKFAAIISSGLFGFLALFGSSRKADGKFSAWGKISLSGVIVSTVIAGLTQVMEDQRNRESDLENKQMLLGIQRAAYPFIPTAPPEFYLSVALPLKHERLLPYRARLKQLIQNLNIMDGYKTNLPHTTVSITQGMDGDGTGKVVSIFFEHGSPAFPQAETEPALHDWITHFGIDVRFQENDLENYQQDLKIQQICDPERMKLEYKLFSEILSIEGGGTARVRDFTKSAKYASLADLAGAYLVVDFMEEDRRDDLDTERRNFESDASLEAFSFTIANIYHKINDIKTTRTLNTSLLKIRMPDVLRR